VRVRFALGCEKFPMLAHPSSTFPSQTFQKVAGKALKNEEFSLKEGILMEGPIFYSLLPSPFPPTSLDVVEC